MTRCGTPLAGTGCPLGAGAGASAGPDSPAWARIVNHPCYSESAHHYYARIHLPVAPRCNIQCNYCSRKFDCANESRPGVSSRVLTPAQAVNRVGQVLARLPEVTVVGIAGPGDPLANAEQTFATFRLVHERYPDLRLCLSTNGLQLPGAVDRIVAARIDHVTVTVNALDPDAGAEIYRWVYLDRTTYRGPEGARLLIDRQLEGISALVARDVLVKVNCVMVPGVNDRHLVEVAREVKRRGAFIVNVMPLIPVAGTRFGHLAAPSWDALKALQSECEGEVRLMRHCRQCRADSIGLLGQDRSAEFNDAGDPAPAYDPAARQARLAELAKLQAAQVEAQRRLLQARGLGDGPTVKVAVATKGHGMVNLHFGHATEFLIYEASARGVRLLGPRVVDRYCTGLAECDEDGRFERVLSALADCGAVLSSRIGQTPADRLRGADVEPVETFGLIESAVLETAQRLLARSNDGRARWSVRDVAPAAARAATV